MGRQECLWLLSGVHGVGMSSNWASGDAECGKHLETPQWKVSRPGLQRPLALWPEISPNSEKWTCLSHWRLAAGSRPFLFAFNFSIFLSFSICSSCRQPKPFVLNQQQGYSRAFLAWNMGDYENIQQRDSKRAILVKQSKLLRSTPPSRLPKLPSKEEKVSCHFLDVSLEKPCWGLESVIWF